MDKLVVGLFDQMEHARMAVNELVHNGFRRDDISLIAADREGRFKRYFGEEGKAEDIGEGAAGGAGIGAILGGLGGLLVGLGLLTIPGIGPVLAAGPLATTLAGAGIGAAAGGLVGALVGAGIPDEEAKLYAAGVERGGTLVTVNTTDEMSSTAISILNHHNPIDVHRQTSERVEMPRQAFDTPDIHEPVTNYEDIYRNHFATTYAGTDFNYSDFRPYYQFGYGLARDERYRNRRWEEIEIETRRDWERSHPDTLWDDVRDAVRAGWESVTGSR